MENKSGSFMMPTSYFGISLGLFSLGLAYRYAAKAAGVPFLFSEILLILAASIWIVFIGIYICQQLLQVLQVQLEQEHLDMINLECYFLELECSHGSALKQ